MIFYDEWMGSEKIPDKYKTEIIELKNAGDEEELNDRFYKELSFGTAGLRGKIGQGTNRMNEMTVGRASQGLADAIISCGKKAMEKGVVIAYDVRHMSKEFAEISARILAGNGIKVYLYDSFRTTPLLSFSILELGAMAGIMVTASHNPKEYNGYKVYWEDGAQISFEISDLISEKIKDVGGYGIFKISEYNDKNIIKIGDEIEDKFLKIIENYDFNTETDKDVKIIYTPLNGTGNLPVRKVMKNSGFKNVIPVKEQENPDPDFTTVGYPNPEDPKAFKLAEKLGIKERADILIATDPDCDRMAIGLPKDKGYFYPTGNQIGILMIDFLTTHLPKEIIEKSFMVKSVVTGNLGKKIAESRGVDFYETLTGFKNICGKAIEIENATDRKFLFGYEESIGFLYGSHVRDKDAVVSSRLIAEMAGRAKKRGFDFINRLNKIYEEYGFYKDLLIQKVLEGQEGQIKIKGLMDNLRYNPPKKIGDMQVMEVIDYKNHSDFKMRSDLLSFIFSGNSKLSIRPSGTEPKLKFYIESVGENNKDAENKENEIKKFVNSL